MNANETRPLSGGPELHQLVRASQGRWVLDSAHSTAEFHVKHFWRLITVHGAFELQEGEGNVEPDGAITGVIRIQAASLNTKNRKRDEHLRSTDFFDAEHHPTVTVTVTRLGVTGDGVLRGDIRLQAAGRTRPVQPLLEVVAVDNDSVTLRAEATVDRTDFGMTWSPLGIAARQAQVVITARFVRP